MSALEDVLLHCLKYSGQDVYGLLLASSGDEPTLCVPLFHTACVSVPMIRTALSLIDCCDEYRIIGIYFASNGSTGVTPVARMLHSTISSIHKGRDIVVWRFDSSLWNSTTSADAMGWPFSAYSISSDKEVKRDRVLNGFSSERFKCAVNEESHVTRSFDFEDFMADSSVEWIKC